MRPPTDSIVRGGKRGPGLAEWQIVGHWRCSVIELMSCCVRLRGQEEPGWVRRCKSGIKPFPLSQKCCQSRFDNTSRIGMCEGGKKQPKKRLLAQIWSLSFSHRLVWAWARRHKILRSWGKWYASLLLILKARVCKFSYALLYFQFKTMYRTGQSCTLIRSSWMERSSVSLSARRAAGCEPEEHLLFLPVTPVYTLCPFNSTACPVIYNWLEVWKTLAKNSCSVCVEHSWNPACKEWRRRGRDFTRGINLEGLNGGRIQCSTACDILCNDFI